MIGFRIPGPIGLTQVVSTIRSYTLLNMIARPSAPHTTQRFKRREPRSLQSSDLQTWTKSIFPTGGVDWRTVKQQNLIGCPLPAVLTALANACPKQFKLILQGPFKADIDSWVDGLTEEHFSNKEYFRVNFSRGWSQRLTPMLYMMGSKPFYALSTDGTAWVSLIEKAYVMFRAGHLYENLNADEGATPPTVEQIMFDFFGPFIGVKNLSKPDVVNFVSGSGPGGTNWDITDSRTSLLTLLRNANKRATIAVTHDENSGFGLINFHTYSVIKYDRGHIYVHEAMRGSDAKLTLDQFKKGFESVYQASQHSACSK